MLRSFPFGKRSSDEPEPEGPSEEIQEREPKTADGNKRLADLHLQKGRLNNAITRYKKAARLEDDPEHRTDLGDAYAFAELPVSAVTQYRKALKRDPKCAEPHFSLAEVYARYGKWHIALGEYNTAIELEPENAFYRHKIAAAYKIIGQIDPAIEHLEHAVASRPADGFYHFELAALYADVDRIDEAALELEQAVAFSPGDDYYTCRLAMCYARLGRFEDAAETFRESLRLKMNPCYLVLLGDVYMWQGRDALADAKYDEAGDLDPYDMDFIERARKFIHGACW